VTWSEAKRVFGLLFFYSSSRSAVQENRFSRCSPCYLRPEFWTEFKI
jgi:hypothetical protein